jgi:zinc protease
VLLPVAAAVVLSAGAVTADDAPLWPASTRAASAPAGVVTVAETLPAAGGVTVVRLSNGLTVIVKPTSQSPVVCVRCYVRAGGMHEGEWLGCGISHLTEHLVAKGAIHDMGGSTDVSVAHTTGRVKEIGGQSNAYTTLDHTCYYISAAAGKTDECIDLVADWMARVRMTRDEFEKQHGIVQRELETGQDDPTRQLWKAQMASFFQTHPAAVPVIGYLKPLSELTYQDVLAYHRRMYVPQDMVFVVVGDVDAGSVLETTCRAFQGFAAGRVPDLSLPPVPRSAGVRRTVVPHPGIKETIEDISFRSVPLISDDLYALDVLSYVLAQGRASRLMRNVVRRDMLATSISSSSWTPSWGDGMFTVNFRAEPDKAERAEKAILDELRTVAVEGVSADELDRAKRQKVADYVYSRQTVESMASTLGSDYLSTADVGFSRLYTDRIQSVSAEQVLKAAAKYFDFDSMCITSLVPESPAAATRKATSAPAGGAGASAFTLPNGLRVVLKATGGTGLTAMAFVSRGGLLVEDKQTNGLGTLTTALSTKGAGGRSAEQIGQFFDRAGGSIAGNCGNNSFYWQATVLEDSFPEALGALSDVICSPDFPASELEILRPIALNAIRRQDEDWQGKLSRFFRKCFFTNSPYGMLPSGSEEVVSAATVEQIAAHYRRNILAGSSVLTIYGSFDADETANRVKELFAKLPAGQVKLDIPAPRKIPEMQDWHVERSSDEVAGITVGAPGMTLSQLDDRLAMDVLDTIISGWRLPSGWLHEELRGKQLVYVVHALNWAGLAPGTFEVYAACQPAKAREVVDIIVRDLRKASAYTPTREEIDLAVNTILTAELLENQDVSSLALSAALDELYGFGYDFRSRMEKLYRQVTPADVLRVGEKYLSDGYLIAVTTPQPDDLPGQAEQDQ